MSEMFSFGEPTAVELCKHFKRGGCGLCVQNPEECDSNFQKRNASLCNRATSGERIFPIASTHLQQREGMQLHIEMVKFMKCMSRQERHAAVLSALIFKSLASCVVTMIGFEEKKRGFYFLYLQSALPAAMSP